MANPITLLANLNGSIACQDRAGSGTLTGTGAVLYATAEGARWNLLPRSSFENAAHNYATYSSNGASGTPTNSTEWAADGDRSCKVAITAVSASKHLLVYPGGSMANNPYCACPRDTSLQHTVSATIYNVDVPGLRVTMQVTSYDLAGNVLQTHSGSTPTLPVGEETAVSFTFTPNAAAHQLRPQFLLSSSEASDQTGTAYFDVIQIEEGASATAFVSGVNGGVWLNPFTGQLGTAHDSPAVSQAQLLDLESTTNYCTNPLSESDHFLALASGSGHTATTTRVTTHAWLGSASSLLDVTVLGTMPAYYIGGASALQVAALPAQAWSGQVRARGSGTGRLMIAFRQAGGTYISGTETGDIVLTDGWQHVELENIVAPALTAWVEMRWQARTTGSFYLDAAQLEQKVYCTPFAAGSMGTGFAWAGTANASASTRTGTFVYTAIVEGQNAPAITPTMKLSAAAHSKKIVASWPAPRLIELGSYGVNPTAVQLMRYQDDARVDNWVNGASDVAVDTANDWGDGLDDYAWGFAYGQWDNVAGQMSVRLDDGALATGSMTTLADGWSTSPKRIAIGVGSGGTNHLNGQIGPVALFDDTLTDAEIDRLDATLDWEWEMLNRPERSKLSLSTGIGLGD